MATFKDWLGGCNFEFVVGWDRYSNYTHDGGWVCVASIDVEPEILRAAVDDLQGGDNDMFEALKRLRGWEKDESIYLGAGDTPLVAMEKLEDRLWHCWYDLNVHPEGRSGNGGSRPPFRQIRVGYCSGGSGGSGGESMFPPQVAGYDIGSYATIIYEPCGHSVRISRPRPIKLPDDLPDKCPECGVIWASHSY